MNGWEIKPLGWLLLLVIIVLAVYGSYRAIVCLRNRQISSDAAP
jgi:hypothetical protein